MAHYKIGSLTHEYTSTYCQHGDCTTCATIRLTCKWCGEMCRHGCHTGGPIDPPATMHVYLSTACLHGRHAPDGDCKTTCVVCHTPCICKCHMQSEED